MVYAADWVRRAQAIDRVARASTSWTRLPAAWDLAVEQGKRFGFTPFVSPEGYAAFRAVHRPEWRPPDVATVREQRLQLNPLPLQPARWEAPRSLDELEGRSRWALMAALDEADDVLRSALLEVLFAMPWGPDTGPPPPALIGLAEERLGGRDVTPVRFLVQVGRVDRILPLLDGLAPHQREAVFQELLGEPTLPEPLPGHLRAALPTLSERLVRKALDHPQVGPSLRADLKDGAIVLTPEQRLALSDHPVFRDDARGFAKAVLAVERGNVPRVPPSLVEAARALVLGDLDAWVVPEKRGAAVSALLRAGAPQERWLLWALDHPDSAVQAAGVYAAKAPLSDAVRERLIDARPADPRLVWSITELLFADDPSASLDRVLEQLTAPHASETAFNLLVRAEPDVSSPALLRVIDDPVLEHFHERAAMHLSDRKGAVYEASRARIDALLRPTWEEVP